MSEITKPMAHLEAETMKAVDLYLLNELTDEQRMRFEEHYFDCTICAEAVEAGQLFVNGIHPIPAVEVSWWRRLISWLGKPVLVPSWRQWAYGGITALSLLGIAWQRSRLVFPGTIQANTIILAREPEKGADDEKAYSLRTASATVELNLPPEAAFPFYRIFIQSDRGKSLSLIVPGPADESDHRLSVQVASDALGSGHFSVRVEGLRDSQAKAGVEAGRYYFALKN